MKKEKSGLIKKTCLLETFIMAILLWDATYTLRKFIAIVSQVKVQRE